MSDLFSDLQWRGLVYDSTQGAKDLLAREKVTAYSRLRSHRVEPACRPPDADHGARAAAARRPLTDRAGRRRHRPDRRSQRQDRRAHAAEQGGCRGERPRHSIAARALSRFRRASQSRAARRQRRVAELDERDGVSARRRQVLHRELPARQGIGQAAARKRRGHFVHRIQLFVAAGLRLSRAARSLRRAGFRWAAAINGATSSPAPISFASCGARRRTAS